MANPQLESFEKQEEDNLFLNWEDGEIIHTYDGGGNLATLKLAIQPPITQANTTHKRVAAKYVQITR